MAKNNRSVFFWIFSYRKKKKMIPNRIAHTTILKKTIDSGEKDLKEIFEKVGMMLYKTCTKKRGRWIPKIALFKSPLLLLIFYYNRLLQAVQVRVVELTKILKKQLKNVDTDVIKLRSNRLICNFGGCKNGKNN